jgi:HK97 family phage portal protein
MASWIPRLFRGGRVEDRALTRENVPAVMLASTVAGESISATTALRIVDVLACVRLLAETASTLPLIAYRRAADGTRTRHDGRIARLLDRPAPAMTQANLIAQTVGCLALRGNCFWGLYRNGEGEIEQLGVLSPDRVQVEIKGGLPLYTLSHDDGKQSVHGTEDVLHFKGLSLDGVLGLSPIAQAREALGLASALTEHASALFANGAAPKGVLSVPTGPAQEDVMENLRAAWEARHGGARQAGRVAVLAGEITFHPISLTPQDSEFVASRKLSTQEIARLFRVPAHLINGESGTSLTYSTVEMDALNFVRFSLSPWLTVIEQAITQSRELCMPSVYVEFLLDAFLRASSETRAQVYTAALDPITGWLRREEVRRFENLDAEPVNETVEAA